MIVTRNETVGENEIHRIQEGASGSEVYVNLCNRQLELCRLQIWPPNAMVTHLKHFQSEVARRGSKIGIEQEGEHDAFAIKITVSGRLQYSSPSANRNLKHLLVSTRKDEIERVTPTNHILERNMSRGAHEQGRR